MILRGSGELLAFAFMSEWHCEQCTLINEPGATRCAACDYTMSSDTQQMPLRLGPQMVAQPTGGSVLTLGPQSERCTSSSVMSVQSGSGYSAPRYPIPTPSAPPPDPPQISNTETCPAQDEQQQNWQCSACTLLNDQLVDVCNACGNMRPTPGTSSSREEADVIHGDHICFPRFGYWHHAIYVGNGDVVHFTGEPLDNLTRPMSRASIRQQPLRDLLKNRKAMYVCELEDGVDRTRTAERAHLLLADQQGETGFGGRPYHVLWNNCESFCEICKFGERRGSDSQAASYMNALQNARGSFQRGYTSQFAPSVTERLPLTPLLEVGRLGVSNLVASLRGDAQLQGRWLRCSNAEQLASAHQVDLTNDAPMALEGSDLAHDAPTASAAVDLSAHAPTATEGTVCIDLTDDARTAPVVMDLGDAAPAAPEDIDLRDSAPAAPEGMNRKDEETNPTMAATIEEMRQRRMQYFEALQARSSAAAPVTCTATTTSDAAISNSVARM